MTRLRRDLTTVIAIVAAVVASLIVVRLTASGSGQGTAPTATEEPPSTWSTTTAASDTTATPTSSTAPTPAGGSTSSGSVRREAQQPAATMALSAGAPVILRPDPTPRTPRPAATPPVAAAAVGPPADEPAPDVYQDPAILAQAWLNTLCWYDYRGARTDNTRRAALYGDTAMPAGQDPWTLDEQAWQQITAAQLSSACTGITATVETVSHPTGPDSTTVRLTATQVLSSGGAPYQTAPVTLTRTVNQDPAGRWLIGRPVTAN